MAAGRRHPVGAAGAAIMAAATLTSAVGCAPKSHIYDPVALANAKRLAVMPAVSAPGTDGQYAGGMQAGVIIGSLSDLARFDVEGPGRLRRALAEQADQASALWRADLQGQLAKKLGIDMLVVSELHDYRYTKKTHQTSFLFGSTRRTSSTYWVSVSIRIVEPVSGKLMYSGQGGASSEQGYGPAVVQATEQALKELKDFLRSEKRS